MLPKPRQDLVPNTAEFERLPFVKQTGFREYDARWRYPEETIGHFHSYEDGFAGRMPIA